MDKELVHILRLLKVPDVPSVVLKSAPSTCNIFVVLHRKLTLKFANQLGIGGASINMPVKTVSRKLLTRAEQNGIFGKQIFSSSSEIHNAPEENYEASGVGGYLDSSASSNETQENTNAGERKLGVNNWERSEALSKDALLTTFPYAVDVKDDAHFDFHRLPLELQRTLAKYYKFREDLIHAKKKVELLSSERSTEVNRVRDAVEREKMLKKIAAEEMAKPLEVVKEAEHTRKLLPRESLISHQSENFAKRLSFDKPGAFESLCSSSKNFHRYSKSEIEAATDNFSDAKKIGEGTYGCVYKCILDQIVVAVKVVRQDAPDKKEEFLREVEVLSQLKHPHMVSLLGFCPESGCLVYEYMENGSLEDQLFYRKNSPPLPWFIRFRILFEVACALAFLHGNKPDPIVHRDVKPGNILLDKNYVSKVGDVGLARLVSDIVPDNVTEYKETMLAGTLYYMDPEYLRTGTVRPKSDLYALGIIALQLLTGKQTTCLVVQVENAIENGTLVDILDKSIPDWPLAEAEKLAKLALKCSKLRCRDRPDLESEILPELEELLEMGNGFHRLKQCNVYSSNH
ncbi:hypothetical protein HPP92_008596 [Vanilla planifolia]|uniref:RING-type E3 ubiquitin transferase n=1 Tax=Vanilla planifolia TaxID=51239 RepID=A0A835R6A3_VANPL|nr:hypothetical protein HPP92_008596 [Vanilla planifolia]